MSSLASTGYPNRHPPRPPAHGQPVGRNSRMDRTLARERAVGNLRNALSESGLDSNAALRYARLILTRPGVQVGKGGSIYYNGRQFTAGQFANSTLARFVTGKTATARNEQAINTDPNYLQAIANLGLARDQALGQIQSNRQNALIQFGDPAFAGSDSATAGAAAANPFSTVNLMARAYQQANQGARENANRLGTYQGGGLTSGLNENQRLNAAQEQDATLKLQQLLSQLSSEQGQAGQAYSMGQQNAHLATYQQLLQAGLIHAAAPPALSMGQFHFHGLPLYQGGPHAIPQPPPPPGGYGGGGYQTRYPNPLG